MSGSKKVTLSRSRRILLITAILYLPSGLSSSRRRSVLSPIPGNHLWVELGSITAIYIFTKRTEQQQESVSPILGNHLYL